MSLITPCHADELDTIRELRYFHDLNYKGNLAVSFAGGAIISIDGSGFNDEPIANSIKVKTTTFSDAEMTIASTPMNGKWGRQLNFKSDEAK